MDKSRAATGEVGSVGELLMMGQTVVRIATGFGTSLAAASFGRGLRALKMEARWTKESTADVRQLFQWDAAVDAWSCCSMER